MNAVHYEIAAHQSPPPVITITILIFHVRAMFGHHQTMTKGIKEFTRVLMELVATMRYLEQIQLKLDFSPTLFKMGI